MPTFSANGDGDEFVVGTQGENAWLHADGAFGGGTITWNFKGLDNLFHPLTNGALTVDHDKYLPLPGGTIVRPTLSGATAPSIYYEAR